MVKSTSSCFKIITCSNDLVEDDDVDRIERKGATDKRRWSFRKSSSGKHQIINNPMVSEASSPGNKEKPELTSIGSPARTFPTVAEKISTSQCTDDPKSLPNTVNLKASDPVEKPESISIGSPAQTYPAVPEKISTSQWTDDPKSLSDAANLKSSDPEIATENASKGDPFNPTESFSKTDSLTTMDTAAGIDSNLEESVAVVIQAAIRGYLSQRAILKLKNVIKLQAAFRGLLVRRQAVGTLRCVQAIIKMQALVRARRARMSLDESIVQEKLDEKPGQSVKLQVIGIPGTKVKSNFSSTEKLLGNGFARQLLESMPKKKPIQVKCDPLRSDSAWKWLERWVSVSPSDATQPQKPQSNSKNEEQIQRTDRSASGLRTEVVAEVLSESTDLKSNARETETAVEDEERLITNDPDNFQFQFCPSTSSIGNDPEPSSGSVALSEVQENSSNIDINQNESLLEGPNKKLDFISGKPGADSEPPQYSMKQVGSEQPETEGKKIVVGSRKASNPAFVAAQSKFEELSSTATAGRSVRSTPTQHDIGKEQKLDNLSLSTDSVIRTEELIPADNSISHDPRNHTAGLACDTKLPISSPHGSSVRSEVASEKHEINSEAAAEVICVTKENASHLGNIDDEFKEESPSSRINSSYSISVQTGKLECPNEKVVDSVYANGEAVDSIYASGPALASIYANGAMVASVNANGEAVDSVYANGLTVDSSPAKSLQVENAKDQQTYRSSPDRSPKGHITGPESQTPSSQVSVDAKRKKSNKSEPTQKRKSQSGSKKSPSKPSHDSGGRNSTEQLPKDLKNGKRRDSLGFAKLDLGDQESKDSSSNSLPSYMQATKSAKAKALANNSPRSPDLHDNELYIKKRHSLPNGNGQQGSPRIQSSTPPQAQQGAKGQRERWQR